MTFPITPIDANAFANGWRLEWTDGCPLNVNDQFNALTARYDFPDGQAVTIDVDGPAVFFNQCGGNFGFIGGFSDGDFLIQGDNQAGRMPVHLIFENPVRAVGAAVGVVGGGGWGSRYTTQMWVRLDGQPEWWPVTSLLVKSQAFETTPFLGARANAGEAGIKQVYFDAMGSSNRVPVAAQIAINDLHVLD